MENYTCQNCGREIPECNRTLHGLACKNSITSEEYQDLIPCEYCNHLISFGDYNNHIQNCEAHVSFIPNSSGLLTPIRFTGRGSNPEPVIHQQPEPYEYDFFSALDDILDRIQNDNLINIPHINPEDIDNYEELTNLSETIGNVNVGIGDINEYLIANTYSIEKPFMCEICQTSKLDTFITECQHEFCRECCDSWFSSNKKCPYCNLELKKLQK